MFLSLQFQEVVRIDNTGDILFWERAMNPERKRGAGKANVVVGDDDFDNGPHLPITPEGKKLVDDTIWELVGRQLTP